ncbi:MAG: hypothetical protein V3S21_03385 [Xanthomonadales bacterium]
MIDVISKIFLLVISSSLYIGVVQAQHNTSPNDQDSSGKQAEAREDAYRKSMELAGSRDRDTFSNTTYTAQARREKIDKLPKESRDNIRDQLTDIIIESGQWEPFDALREYPYDPSEAAQEDPGLRDREQEAWAEQMEKYHQREARAFEANRPSMPGSDSQQAASPSGQPNQEQGGQDQSQGESEGEGRPQSSQHKSPSSAGSYEPYQSQQNDDADEISTAGVSESALAFLRAKQGQDSSSAEDGDTTSQQSNRDSQRLSESEFVIPGTIAIKDLDKLEGLAEPEDDSENL